MNQTKIITTPDKPSAIFIKSTTRTHTPIAPNITKSVKTADLSFNKMKYTIGKTIAHTDVTINEAGIETLVASGSIPSDSTTINSSYATTKGSTPAATYKIPCTVLTSFAALRNFTTLCLVRSETMIPTPNKATIAVMEMTGTTSLEILTLIKPNTNSQKIRFNACHCWMSSLAQSARLRMPLRFVNKVIAPPTMPIHIRGRDNECDTAGTAGFVSRAAIAALINSVDATFSVCISPNGNGMSE